MINDHELAQKMARSQTGDRQAYQQLLLQVTDLLHGYLKYRVSYAEAREDVIQEILISVHQARHTYDASRAFKPWLFSIAKFRLYDYLRKRYRHQELEQAYTEVPEEGVEENFVERLVLSQELQKLLKTLPKKQAEMVRLTKVEGYTAKEVAEKYDMQESAVKVAVYRALKQLKQDYEELNG